MDILFGGMAGAVKTVQAVACYAGLVILMVAYVVYFSKVGTQDSQYIMVGFAKLFIFSGLCLFLSQIFNFTETLLLSIAKKIEPNIVSNPLQFATGMLLSNDTAEKLEKAEESKQEAEPQKPEKNIFGGFVDGLKSTVSCLFNPVETGKKIVSGVYATMFRWMAHVVSWFGALAIIIAMVMQYAVCVVVRMFLPLAFACLTVPAMVGIGMNILLTGVNVLCWPIGFAIVQKMLGAIVLDTQLASIVGSMAMPDMCADVIVRGCGLLAVGILGTFGYLAVPALVSKFVGGGLSASGVTNGISNMLGGAIGGAVSGSIIAASKVGASGMTGFLWISEQ